MIATVLNFVRRSPLYVLWILGLMVALGIGAACGLYVLINGLGVTNLTDELPWGLWITLDLSAIALGAGAFTLSAAVYIFGLHRYEAIARAAVFVGLLGYTSAMLALAMDIGRPDRFYHPMIYWNVHSVLWEITMCVMFYTTVLLMEFIPVVIESTPLRRRRILVQVAHLLHRIMPVVALIGMGLSLLHQSSLGATYGILTARPVWFSPTAPVLFILSAVAAGPSLTLFVTLLTGMLRRKRMIPLDVQNGVARFIGFAILAYLYLKVWSWAATNYYSHSPGLAGSLELLSENTPYGFTFWWLEILLGALVPAVIFLWPRLRRNPLLLMLGSAMVIGGLVVYRWNVTLSGLTVPLDWSPGVAEVFPINNYEPALVEWGVAMGIVAYSWFAFSLGARFLRLYPQAKSLDEIAAEEAAAAQVETAPAPTPAPEPGGAPSPAR